MPKSEGRPCPLCQVETVPVYRALCRWCFDKVPWQRRAEFLYRWRRRAQNNAQYQEELADLRMWYVDKFVPVRKEQGIERSE